MYMGWCRKSGDIACGRTAQGARYSIELQGFVHKRLTAYIEAGLAKWSTAID
jgi:hypothetical protein